MASSPSPSYSNIELDSQSSSVFDRKLQEATAGLHPYIVRNLQSLPDRNAKAIVDYLLAMKTEKNLSSYFRELIIKTLCKLSRACNSNSKDFKAMEREDILAFLDSYRKTDASDPSHKWIGTYNIFMIVISTFFKWLYFPDMEGKMRPKPAVIENIPKLKRKEISIYKPTDLWTAEDDLLFLKYCPSKRDKCYHAISRDLSCRPHEILNLRIKDVHFKVVGQSQYAEVTVNGKTGTRSIPLINSIPFLKDWIDDHVQSGNPNAFLIPSFKRKNFAMKMSVNGLRQIYTVHYKKNYFPKLLLDPSVPPETKQQIKELLRKPWNPYIRRHSALTEKSMILKEHVLRQHSGWSPRSQMHLKYLHYFGNESSNSLLEAYGLINPDERADIFVLKPLQCPNCNEPNKPDSRFCVKCRMILSYDAYTEALESQKQKDKSWDDMRKEIDEIKAILMNDRMGKSG